MRRNNSFKKIIFLSGIIGLGFILRIPNLDFPSIGYHNMKENEYLSIAQEMKRTEDFITRRVYFYHSFDDTPIMKIYPQIPMISYQTLLAWKFFGENMWGPRLINVIFGILSIVIIYFIAELLFNNATLALFGAFLLAIMPLSIFFSRNLQPESPAFFFMLLGNLFYLRFCAFYDKYGLFWGGIFFSIAWIYKSTFIFGVIPFLCCFNFKEIFKKKSSGYKLLFNSILPYSLIFLAVLWLRLINQWEFEELTRIDLLKIFSFSYWKTSGLAIWDYAWSENFAKIPLLLAFLGIFIALFKKKDLAARYIVGWIIAAILYSVFFADYINQHSYYQMPFLTLICVASIYAVMNISGITQKKIKHDYLKYLICLLLGATITLAFSELKLMHNFVFFGEDIAGESLREFTKPNERVFLYTYCQGFGIARYAQRYMHWPNTLEQFKKNEKKFSIKYACFYPCAFFTELKQNSPEFFQYIQSNYRIKETGFLESNKIFQSIYLILEKNNNLNQGDFYDFKGANLKLRKIYKIFTHTIPCYSLRSG